MSEFITSYLCIYTCVEKVNIAENKSLQSAINCNNDFIKLFFFPSRINRCTRCLLFIDRHTNLLQYRESMFSFFTLTQLTFDLGECNDADELSSVTLCPNMIAPDAPLYTLYRSKLIRSKKKNICSFFFLDNSKPQLCPIQPPFVLSKYIKDGTTCTQSSSSIDECANDYQFRLHLSPCSLTFSND